MKAEQPPQAVHRVQFQLLSEVNEDEADGGLKAIYDDIQRCLGVSLVGSMFRSLGAFPAYLEQAWGGLRPNVLSPAFDSGANQIRAEAVRLMSQWPTFGCDVPLLSRLGYLPADVEHLKSGMGTFHYVNPQWLMWVAALRQARENPLGHAVAPRGMMEPDGGSPEVIHQVPPGVAPPEVATRFAWLQRLLGVPVVSSDLQFLGSYPTYFYQLYPQLQDLILNQGFNQAAHSLALLASRLATHLPYRFAWEPGHEEAEQRADLFYELLPRMVLISALINRRLGCSSEYYVR